MKAMAGVARVRSVRSLPLSLLAICAGWIGAVLLAVPAGANPWVPIASPVTPAAGSAIPAPNVVPGKDFSDARDRDAAGVPDPEQVVAWDGSGGVRDSFDYTHMDLQVDGIAAGGDALFLALRDNQAALLFSVETDPNILFERETGLPGSVAGSGVWATALDLDAMNPPLDTDGLEIWGGDNNDDSDRYSLAGDPGAVGGPRVAVWSFTPPGGPSAAHTLTTDLAAAMDLQFAGVGVGGPYWSQLVELMDVDALMTFGPQVTFSIRPIQFQVGTGPAPINVVFDGGEIFLYDGAGVATKFLDHGGHLWDTAFDVRGTFGLNSENVDAIEAVSVPEPSPIALLVLGLLAGRRLARPRLRYPMARSVAASTTATARVTRLLLPFALAIGVAPAATAATLTIRTDSSWLATNVSPDFPWLFDPAFDTTGWINASVNIPACFNGADCIWYDGQFSATQFAWLRTTFIISDPVSTAVLDGGIDDDVDIYVNGFPAYSDHDTISGGFGPIDVAPFLVPGVNLIAVAAEDNFPIFGQNHAFVARLQIETAVPEPASVALLASGLAGFAVLRRRQRQNG
jgi:hypothetical protein